MPQQNSKKNTYLMLVQPKRIEVIPNLIYLSQHKSRTENVDKTNLKDRKPLKLLFFSRIEEKKGLDLLLRGLAICEFPWSLTIAGTGERSYQEKLERVASRLKISHYIKWIGLVKNEDKYEVFADHNLLVLFSTMKISQMLCWKACQLASQLQFLRQ